MAAQFAFEKLEVWQKARAFNKTIYQTPHNFLTLSKAFW